MHINYRYESVLCGRESMMCTYMMLRFTILGFFLPIHIQLLPSDDKILLLLLLRRARKRDDLRRGTKNIF